MEEKLEKIIDVVSKYMQETHQNLYVSSGPNYFNYSFLGYKYNKNDKYYLLFISVKKEHIYLSLRENINDKDVIAINIDNMPDYKILAKIETFLYKKEKNIPIYISDDISSENTIDTTMIYDKIIELEKNINKQTIIDKYSKTSLTSMTISNRLYNGCVRNNITNLAEFLLTPIMEFSKMQWLGRKSLKEIASIKNRYFEGTIEDIKYQRESLNDVYYNLDKLDIKAEISDEEYEKYIDFGINIGTLINDIISSIFSKRNIEMFRLRMNFSDSEENTLEYIGSLYGITRERVRQIIGRIERKIRTTKYKYKLIEKFNSIAEKDDIINYIIIGIYGLYNYDFLTFIFHILDYSESSKILKTIREIFKRNSAKIRYSESAILESINYGEYLNSNADIVFNSLKEERNTNNYNDNGIKKLERFDTEVEYESSLEKEMLGRLQNCKFVKNIKTQSLKIKYEYNNKPYVYYPDFQILTNDKKIVVMEIKPVYNMMDKNVMIKYKALEKYCLRNGFGYLMIDNRYNTYEKLKNNVVDKGIEMQFINMLKLKKQIKYSECKLFMIEHDINLAEIASIVINNCKLIECSFKPFKIKLK